MIATRLPPFANQRKIHDFAIDRLFIKGEKGGLILARVGSGKSRAALDVIETLRDLGEVKHTLLIAPLRVLDFTWPNEITKHNFNFSYTRVNGKPLSRVNSDIVFCTPDSLHKVYEAAKARLFDLLLVDEITDFKTWKTKRMSWMRKILPFIPRRLGMTGTLVANSLQDMHSPAFICDDGAALGVNITTFRGMYMDKGGFKGRGWIMRESAKDKLVNLVGPLSVVIDAADYNDLPVLVPNDVIVNLSPDAQRAHATMKQELFAALQEREANILVGSAGAAYQKCCQIASGFVYDSETKEAINVHTAKIDALQSIIDENGGKPVLVFYNYTANAERIAKAIGKCSILRGGQSDKEARLQIEKWFTGKHQVCLAQTSAVGKGVNLQDGGCDTMVFLELPESGIVMDQCIGRLQREGGAKRIFMFRLLANETVDLIKRDRIEGKLKTQDEFVQGLRDWAANT